MKKLFAKRMMLVMVGLLPVIAMAQTPDSDTSGLQGVLNKLFSQMIPLAGKLTDVAQAIAGFAALWYIAFRVWRHIARAEPIDFYPLLRPFFIGIVILFYLQFIGLLNGVLQPLSDATGKLAGDSREAIHKHIMQEADSIYSTPPVGIYPNDNGNTDQYEQPDGTSGNNGYFSGLKSAFSWFNIKSYVKEIFSWLIGLLYQAVSLCINTIRIFYLIILVILGPIVLGLSVFDGFHHSLQHWLARYINIYLWLPVCNIFGAITSKILENMFTLDQDFSSSTGYIIFMIIAIVGYTTVPNVANYIVQVGGKDTLLHKVNQMSKQAGSATIKTAAMAVGL